MYNYTERYDEVDLENLPQRERRETMIIEDPEKGLLTSLENMPMLKTSSVGAQNQKKEGTCYAYVAARLITRLITQKFPDDFEVNDEEFGLLWDGKNGEFEDNCYLDKSINLNKVRDMLTINKCSITKRYNQMLLFCYTLFTIKIKFGCNGFNLEETLLHFEKNIRKFYDVNVFSPELDTFAFEKFIRPLIIFNYPKKNFEVKSVFYNLNNNSPQRNWILNFPEPAKRALENNLNCVNANVINFDLKCKFDACVALFHVVSYLTENTDLIEAFKNINKHLNIGGVFLFDVWNTPGVYNIKPEVRVKKLSDEKVAITRIAQPEIDTSRNIVNVNYEIIVNNLFTNKFSSFSETHKMRHFGFQEIDLLGKLTGFEMITNEEWITGNVTSENTWGVCYIMKKNKNV